MTPKRLATALTACAGLYTAGWFILSGIAERQILGQLAAQQASGIEIAIGNHARGGFPFALQVTLGDCSLKTKSGVVMTAPILVMGTHFAHWSHATLNAPAGLLVTAPAGLVRGAIDATIANADGTVDFTVGDIRQASLTLNTVAVTGLIAGAGPLNATDISLHVDKPDTPPVDHTQAGAHVVMNADNILLPPPAIAALGNTVKRLTLDATIMDKVPALDETALKAWRDDGGTVEVKELSTEWGPLGLGLGGTLSLDQNLQPLGAFDAKIAGYAQTLDALAASGGIKPYNAHLLAMALSLLAKPEGPAATPTLDVPLSIQDSAVYVTSFKVAKLPEVRLY